MIADEHPSLDRLLAYSLGDADLPDGDVEEHVFVCGECASALDELHRIDSAIVALVRRGEAGTSATRTLLNRMSRDRVNVRGYALEPGETVACTVAANDDYLAGWFALPPGDFGRVDLRVLDAERHELMRVEDVVVDARSRAAILLIPAGPVRLEPSAVTHYELLAVDEGGGDRVVGSYSLDHTALAES